MNIREVSVAQNPHSEITYLFYRVGVDASPPQKVFLKFWKDDFLQEATTFISFLFTPAKKEEEKIDISIVCP